MGRAARLNASTPRFPCEADGCQTEVRREAGVPYLKRADQSFSYVCEPCYDKWVKAGFLYMKVEEQRAIADGV